jgi:hypothetical protein
MTLSAAAATGDRSEREWHAAECVAALDLGTEDLSRQVKAGHEELRPLLLDRLKSGAAFIGQAYLNGERDEARSQALLKEAREAQRALPESSLAARQLSCAEEGSRLLADANVLEREIVSQVARRRMNKLLER